MNDNKRDKSSHLLKEAQESQHTHVWKNDFKILKVIIKVAQKDRSVKRYILGN